MYWSEEIIAKIKNLPYKKVPGHDVITNSAIKNILLQYDGYLATLFIACFKFQHFLVDWKKAINFPIKKPGEDTSQHKYYRPINLLLVLGKLTENIFLYIFKIFYLTFLNRLT